MANKRARPQDVITKLRQVEVLMAEGQGGGGKTKPLKLLVIPLSHFF